MPASCQYQTQAEFVLRWGTKNVASFSNKDNTTTAINEDAVQAAFDFAVEEIHDSLRGSIYTVPLSFDGYDGVISPKVKSWCSVIALCYMYFDRGLDDKSKAGNKYSMLLKQQYDEMGMVRGGLKQIAADTTPQAAGPTATPTPLQRCVRLWIYSEQLGTLTPL